MTYEKQLRLLYIKEFFEEYTDDEHSASMSEVVDYLKKHDIKAHPDAITYDIDALNTFGMRDDVRIDLDENGRCRKLYGRNMDFYEIKMIADCSASSKILSEEASIELINKLGRLVSAYQRRELKRRVIVSGRAKSTNKKILYNLDSINRAIECKKYIEFKYFQYNMNKEREYKHDGKTYRALPRYMIYENNIYYLIANEQGDDKTFRVDRIDNVTICEEDPYKDLFIGKEIDIKTFSKSTFGMFHGDIKEVTMLFKKEMMDTVIDKFGEEVAITIVDEEHFRITVPVAVSPQFFAWIFGLGDNVMIERPLQVVKQMMDMLKERHKAYREGHSKAIYNVKT